RGTIVPERSHAESFLHAQLRRLLGDASRNVGGWAWPIPTGIGRDFYRSGAIAKGEIISFHRSSVVVRVHDEGVVELFLVALAGGASGLHFSFGQSGQKNRGENGDDGNHHQQFNQRKGASPGRDL